jgi:PadR family transcriptional regulator, regulatory protein AphA
MSLPHALLGLINYRPLTGYDLKTTFNASINGFWNASLPQIYRTLHQMEKSGWVLSSIEQQDGKPNRKIYKITDKGKKELRKWLGEPLEISQAKNKMLIKVFFGNQMDHQDLVNQIRERREQEIQFLEKARNEHKQAADRYAIQLDAKEDVRFWLLSLDFGRRKAKMIVDWCDSALEILERR